MKGLPDPKAQAQEKKLLARINATRKRAKLASLQEEIKLRTFCRQQLALLLAGQGSVGAMQERLKNDKLAEHGHYLHVTHGRTAQEAMEQLLRDAQAKAALLGAYHRIGIGAMQIADARGMYQVALVLAADPDPMLGKTGLSREQTDAVMNKSLKALTGCYNAALKTNPKLEGDVVFRVVIGADGRPSSVGLDKRLDALAFDTCALKVVRALKFPRPYRGKPVTLTHPFHFAPADK
jgi:TonB family protein